MERFVSNLWDTLNIVIGNRQRVFVRQRLYILDDKRSNCKDTNWLEKHLSGSQAEGIHLPGSDADFMYVMKQIVVKSLHCENADFIMETKNVKPGFAKLALGHSRYSIEKIGNCQFALSPDANGKVYFSSLIFRDMVVNDFTIKFHQIGKPEPHGQCAALTIKKLECDNMLCLQNKEWPLEAHEWVGRQRKNNWPSKQLVKEIINNGFLLVPIGNPLSPENHLEWRISFSLAEKALVHSMNHTQILCYGLLKLYLKHLIDTKEDCKGLLCSYFLKNALFYCIEEDDLIWEKANLLNCFWTCFERLLDWVRRGHCPNYFIQTNNMFESKIFGQSQERLTTHLFRLYEAGMDTLMKIPLIYSNFILNSTGTNKDTHINNLNEVGCDLQFIDCSSFSAGQDTLKTLLNEIEHIRRISVLQQHLPVDFIFYKLSLFRSNCLLIQYVYKKLLMKDNTINSIQYKQFRQLKRYVLRNCTGYDLCTGFLLYATLNYLLGQYREVVPILEDLLTKFGGCLLYCGPFKIMPNRLEYMNKFCGKGYSIKQKFNTALAIAYTCKPECDFYPAEIQHEVKQYEDKFYFETIIPPKVYAYILLFLTYHKTGDKEARNQTLDKLCESANDKHFITEHERPVVSALLDRCINIATAAC